MNNIIERTGSDVVFSEEVCEKIISLEKQAKEIKKQQDSMKNEILDAMQQINSITGEVKNGAKLMSEGGEKVLAEMGKLASVTLEISGSMNEMSTGVSDINNSMQNINEQSRQNMNSIEKVTGEINKFKV